MTPPRELLPYLHPLCGAPSASTGKRGYLRMLFERDKEGRSILRELERRTPIIVQQELYFDEAMPSMPCVYILSSGGPNVEGDRYQHHIRLRQGAFAHLSTGAATKLAEMRSDYSSLAQSFELEAESYLEYLPEPTIPCRHSRYTSATQIVIDPSATLFIAEIFLSGRRYKRGGEHWAFDLLSIATSASRPDGEPLFNERMVIEPSRHAPCELGAMGTWSIVGNCFLLAPETTIEAVYAQVASRIDRSEGLAIGVSRLPSHCGLMFRVLGNDTATVKRAIRHICSMVRREVKGCALPDEFPWR